MPSFCGRLCVCVCFWGARVAFGGVKLHTLNGGLTNCYSYYCPHLSACYMYTALPPVALGGQKFLRGDLWFLFVSLIGGLLAPVSVAPCDTHLPVATLQNTTAHSHTDATRSFGVGLDRDRTHGTGSTPENTNKCTYGRQHTHTG